MSGVSFLLLLMLAAGGYLAWVWIPIYADHYDVLQATRGFMNRAVKEKDDEKLVVELSKKLATIRRTRLTDAEGEVTYEPVVVVPPEAISWVREADAKPPMLHVSFSYTRVVTYPYVGLAVSKNFDVRLDNDLTVPIWDAG